MNTLTIQGWTVKINEALRQQDPAVLEWALVLLTFTNLGATFWNILSGPSKRNEAALKSQSESLSRLDQRVSVLEVAQREMPKQTDFHELEMTMTELRGTMAVLTERLKPLEAVSDRMQAWAMEQGKK